MTCDRNALIRRGLEGQRESKNLDFKVGFDVTSREGWCEIIKDIVAFANSGGGAILLGANDDGTPAGVEIEAYLGIDPADLTNKIYAYTGRNFPDFEILKIEREGHQMALLIVDSASPPMVFIKDGSHLEEGGRRRPAFVKGSVYFRHGAKSEPGTSDDLMLWLERTLDEIRKSWLGGLRQVVEANPGDQLRIITAPAQGDEQINARIGNDPNAVVVRPQNPETIWPYRGVELINRVRPTLPEGTVFNSHDILCIKRAFRFSPVTHPEYMFKPHENASTQYSEEFARWISDHCLAKQNFLAEAREAYRANYNSYL